MKKCLFAAVVAVGLSTSANAALLDFSFTSSDTSQNVSFQLDSNPAPDNSGSFFTTFFVTGLTRDGSTPLRVDFYTDVIQGGFTASSADASIQYADAYNMAIFSGTTAAPVFAPGVFDLTNNLTQSTNNVLTISLAAPAIPEPAMWAMMIGGFALAGGVLRRRTTSVAFS